MEANITYPNGIHSVQVGLRWAAQETNQRNNSKSDGQQLHTFLPHVCVYELFCLEAL